MSQARPELFAIRAVNQYRRREVLAYIGLRYYLSNRCSVRNRWAHEVATTLILSRTTAPYFRVLHFKDVKPNGEIEHRDMHIPGPNEAFAESALLDACGRAGMGKDFPENVFSYRLAGQGAIEGMFERYFKGFRERHTAIANACRITQNPVVLYTDIKRFYPSIRSEEALRIWEEECDNVKLPSPLRELGSKILNDHAAVKAPRCAGLLTGPMLSHVIGNLVLKEVDSAMRGAGIHYFRYVDDIVLVGTSASVPVSRARLQQLLEERGFALHEGAKDFSVSGSEWLEGEDDYRDDGHRPSWMTLVGGIKHFLTACPGEREDLARAFMSEGIRFPLPDYAQAVWERPRLERFIALAKKAWFRLRVGRITVSGLLRQANELRLRHTSALRNLAAGVESLTDFHRKRRISKLRYHAARLVYLAAPSELPALRSALDSISELRFYTEVLRAVEIYDVSRLISFGTNAVQSAAQALRMTNQPVRCAPAQWTEVERQGLAILHLNGLNLSGPESTTAPTVELNRLARWDTGSEALMRSSDPFIREVACLHGCQSDGRHHAVLDTAFDRDEELALDALNQVHMTS